MSTRCSCSRIYSTGQSRTLVNNSHRMFSTTFSAGVWPIPCDHRCACPCCDERRPAGAYLPNAAAFPRQLTLRGDTICGDMHRLNPILLILRQHISSRAIDAGDRSHGYLQPAPSGKGWPKPRLDLMGPAGALPQPPVGAHLAIRYAADRAITEPPAARSFRSGGVLPAAVKIHYG